jgi:hypothetical protein
MIYVIGSSTLRPLLLLASRDRVSPTEARIEVFDHAALVEDMMFLSDLDHFPQAASNARIYHIIREWLNLHFLIAGKNMARCAISPGLWARGQSQI